MNTLTEKQILQYAIIELTHSIDLAAKREEYQSAADMQRILKSLQEPSSARTFTESEISQLQSKVHKITGDGEIMGLFNQLLGVSAG